MLAVTLSSMLVVACPHCGDAVGVHEGRPQIGSAGVQLWHRDCWEQRDAPIANAVEPPPPHSVPVRRRSRRWLAAPIAGTVVLAGSLGWLLVPRDTALVPPAPIAYEPYDPSELATIRSATSAHDDPPPPAATIASVETNDDDATVEHPPPVPLDERFPTLREWIHPVLAATELYPPQEVRHFGAERHGVRLRPECGAGHCGVDLDGPRGQQVVAVAGGTLVRIERHELGLDGRSGRFVKVQHEDGTLTAYMHLDEVVEGLRVGDHVDAGQVVGLLGATACFSSPAHLHFSLEIPDRPNTWGDITDTHYADPAPYLQRAMVIDTPIVAASVSSRDPVASE